MKKSLAYVMREEDLFKNYRGITEACALEARAETLDQPKCFSIAITWQLKDQTEIKSTSGLMMNQWPYLMHT